MSQTPLNQCNYRSLTVAVLLVCHRALMSACIRATSKLIFTLQIMFEMSTSTFKRSSVIDADIEL